MSEMSDHERLTGIKAVAEACGLAGRPDLIAQAIDQAWWSGGKAATTWLTERVASERTESVPASTPAPTPRLSGPRTANDARMQSLLKASLERIYGTAR
jgi:hypothetical protein